MIRPYLSNIINDYKTLKNLRVHSSNETQFREWKIQLTMSISFISSKDSHETCNMHTKSDNMEIKDKDCMKRFCKILKEHTTKIVNYEKKEMIPLTDEENKSYRKQKVCYICKKEFSTDKNDKNIFKLYHKVRDHCHYTGKLGELLIVSAI